MKTGESPKGQRQSLHVGQGYCTPYPFKRLVQIIHFNSMNFIYWFKKAILQLDYNPINYIFSTLACKWILLNRNWLTWSHSTGSVGKKNFERLYMYSISPFHIRRIRWKRGFNVRERVSREIPRRRHGTYIR